MCVARLHICIGNQPCRYWIAGLNSICALPCPKGVAWNSKLHGEFDCRIKMSWHRALVLQRHRLEFVPCPFGYLHTDCTGIDRRVKPTGPIPQPPSYLKHHREAVARKMAKLNPKKEASEEKEEEKSDSDKPKKPEKDFVQDDNRDLDDDDAAEQE